MMNGSGGAQGAAPSPAPTLSLRSFLLSPLDPATWRAALAILQSAKAISLIDGRTFVIPEDVQTVFPAVADHRLQGAGRGHDSGSRVLIDKVLDSVDVI